MTTTIQSSPDAGTGGRIKVVSLLGVTQILGWGSTYYLPAVLAVPIVRDTGWSDAAVVGGLSWSMIVASIAAPQVGRTIDRYGGRRVLGASSALFSLGLALFGAAPNLVVYYLAWSVLGVGMAAGLYDAAFATLGRYYGATARPSITGLTLIAGFASTVAWPSLAWLEHHFGWRDTCLLLAGLHLVLGTALHVLLLPAVSAAAPSQTAVQRRAADMRSIWRRIDRRFLLLTGAFTLFAFVATGLSVHILEIFSQLGLDTAAAVAVGMVIGPSQVVARVIEFTFGRKLHPIWTGRAGIALNLAGVLTLSVVGGPVVATIAMILYGAGNGTMTIARGTLPLALFGPAGYGARMGLMARPILVAQALAPVVLAPVLTRFGPLTVIGTCAALGGGAVLAFIALRPPADAAAEGP